MPKKVYRAQHSPGPWTVRDTKGEVQILGRHSRNESGGKKPARLAIAIGWDDETRANANLIAAAPDMLVALETVDSPELATLLEMTKPGSDVHDILAVIQEMARAAITKARGEKVASKGD